MSMDEFHIIARIPPSASTIDGRLCAVQRCRGEVAREAPVIIDIRRHVNLRALIVQVARGGAQRRADEVRTVPFILVIEQTVRQRAGLNVRSRVDLETRRRGGDRSAYADRIRSRSRETVKVQRVEIRIAPAPGSKFCANRCRSEHR